MQVRGVNDTTQRDVIGLRSCKGGTNCFSTTHTARFDRGVRAIEPWRFTGKTPRAAIREVLDAVYLYPPGQQGIDGGGFQVMSFDLYYVYAQFESLRSGSIDDLEFAIAPGTGVSANEGRLLVRSSSRLGPLDYGANALRLNLIAENLRKRGGWEAPAITSATHPGYWRANCRPEGMRKKLPAFCS